MISHEYLKRMLQREWRKLEKEQESDFVKGMIRGLKLASLLALDLWQRTKDRDQPNPSGSRRTLFKTIVLAHNQLLVAERQKAIDTLAKVIERAKELQHE